MTKNIWIIAAAALCGCDPECPCKLTPATDALDGAAWEKSAWISVKDAPVHEGDPNRNPRAADGTSWFVRKATNAQAVTQAKFMAAGLGTFDIYVNGKRVGADFLKPGFTSAVKTKYAFTYDVTKVLNTEAGAENVFAAEVSAGWWRDKIVHFAGKKSAFRGVVELTYADGTKETFGSNTSDWSCGIGGPVTHAAIFDGEEFDARIKPPTCGKGLTAKPELNTEFKGKVYPTAGAEIRLRWDLAMAPQEAYCWRGTLGSNDLKGKEKVFGRVAKTRVFDDPAGELEIAAGETLVVDFGQNCAGVPAFEFEAARDTVLTALPGEMLNEANGEVARGNDGPAGSIYRENLRIPTFGMRAVYTFAGEGVERYVPHFTFFGYRYVSISATAPVKIRKFLSVPVTSIKKCMERGRITTGSADVNRLIKNVYWGQLSNYLSVSTDCPQRNERLGWTADTQVFTEAGSFNADTSSFFHKWMRDMRDSQHELGGFPGVAPSAQYGNNPSRLGWADAGVIVPYTIWKQFGDSAIVTENWDAMEKYMARINETKFRTEELKECGNYQWADWLSYEEYESCGGLAFEKDEKGRRRVKKNTLVYWDYLGACYWMWDAQMMARMALVAGKDPTRYIEMEKTAKAYLKKTFFEKDGLVLTPFRKMQTPALFALKLGLVEGQAKAATIAALRKNIAEHGDCLQTGFLGTSILMDTLTANGMSDIAYTILLQHKNPSWLYSVDQGATTIWERWNSYVKATGFGPVGMNSFNHYAYGAVLAWIYKTAAGIASDANAPGFANIVMSPVPDARLGCVDAEYQTPHGLVKSAWRYDEDGTWIWDFTVPEGATATVTLPGESASKQYDAGTYHIEVPKKK